MSRTWWIAALVFACACSKGDGEPSRAKEQPPAIDARSAPTDTELAAIARQQVELLERLAAAAQASKGDCAAMAESVTAIVSSNRAFYDRMARLVEDDDTARKLDTLAEALADRTEAAMHELEPALTPCMADPALAAAMDSILL